MLGRHFDHHPELVPEAAQSKAFHAQYAATLALYRTEFNQRPPAEIWAAPKFGAAGERPDSPGSNDTAGLVSTSDVPLHMFFGGDGAGEGGGGFSGGGGGAAWADDAVPDAGTADGSDGGGDG